jgi:lipopolysaccharide/colanic/teichoic acid biosynthesis glycosyltransferase
MQAVEMCADKKSSNGVFSTSPVSAIATSVEIIPKLSASQLVVKRIMDITVSVLSLPFFAVATIILIPLISFDSPGPVFYKQTRIGKNGRTFSLYKFRSMYIDADQRLHDVSHLNEAEGPVFKIRKDPRVTRVGYWLRRSSIDELPQILNVLLGNMSLVGPRPPLPREVEKYTKYQWGRLAVKPGITCLWQIEGRSNLSFERWVELDLEYIRRQSLLLDLSIILRTIPAVLRGNGAW